MKFTTASIAFLASLTSVSAFTKNDGFISEQTNTEGHVDTVGQPMILMYDPDQEETGAVGKLLDEYDMNKNGSIKELKNSAFHALILKNGAGHHCRQALSAMAEVAVLEESVKIQSFLTQREGEPWGLQRISNDAGASGSPNSQDFVYSFEDEQLGAGVDIYILDTGVRKTHAVFGNRAQEEEFSVIDSAEDLEGHGTHCAGTAAGAPFGVARGANIFAVKVLGQGGSGSAEEVLEGIDWVVNNHDARKAALGDQFVGSIMSMSWGLETRLASIDNAIKNAVSRKGIHASIAAGNSATDACLSSPSNIGGSVDENNVVTVGAVNINNEIAEFSNTGRCVDIYAPGEQILSAWFTGDNVINFLSGTSMACPHTTGVMAYLMAEDKSLGEDPAALKRKLLATARENAFTGNTNGGANLLLSNGVDGGIRARRLMKNYVVPEHGEKRNLGGSLASMASKIVRSVDRRWKIHSEKAQLVY